MSSAWQKKWGFGKGATEINQGELAKVTMPCCHGLFPVRRLNRSRNVGLFDVTVNVTHVDRTGSSLSSVSG